MSKEEIMDAIEKLEEMMCYLISLKVQFTIECGTTTPEWVMVDSIIMSTSRLRDCLCAKVELRKAIEASAVYEIAMMLRM